MIDTLLEIGAGFDYFSPLVSVLGNLAHGGGYTFTFPVCEMTPREVEWMLRDNGVTTWGLMHTAGTTMITVKKQDAQRAYALLERAGVPIENPPKMARSPRPKRRGQAGGPFKVFDSVFGERCQYCGVMLNSNATKCAQCGAPR